MKYLYLSMALIAAVFTTTTARAETINCTEITAIPMVITVQGVYCLKGNLATSLSSGNMIEIQTNNVTIDFNGFKLGGLSAGLGTTANGIFAFNRKNITIRNGTIRGFRLGIILEQAGSVGSSGHLIEDMLLDRNRKSGIQAEGSDMIISHNRVVNTGPTDLSDTATGIFLSISRNSVIAGNLVSGTSETIIAAGIRVFGSALIEVRGNTIFNVVGATYNLGISMASSTNITVIGNKVFSSAGTGFVGIFDQAGTTGLNCIDNIVAGYTTALTGCDFMVGNITP